MAKYSDIPYSDDVTIRAAPSHFFQIAHDIEALNGQISAVMQQIIATQKRLSDEWDSDSRDMYVQFCKRLEKWGNKIVQALADDAETIAEISGIYSRAENKVQQNNTALPTDIFK